MTQNKKHPIEKTLFEIEGAPVVFVNEGRIDESLRHDDLHYYDMRHESNNWAEPATVEKRVLCDFFGTLATTAPITSIENGQDIIFENNTELLDLIMQNRDSELVG